VRGVRSPTKFRTNFAHKQITATMSSQQDQAISRAELLAQYKQRKALGIVNSSVTGAKTTKEGKPTEGKVAKSVKIIKVAEKIQKSPKRQVQHLQVKRDEIKKKPSFSIFSQAPSAEPTHVELETVTKTEAKDAAEMNVQEVSHTVQPSTEGLAVTSVEVEKLQEMLSVSSQAQVSLKIELETRQNEADSLRQLSSSLQSKLTTLRETMLQQIIKEEELRAMMEADTQKSEAEKMSLIMEIKEYKTVIDDKENLVKELDELVSCLRHEIDELNSAPAAYADNFIVQVQLEKLEAEMRQKNERIAELEGENSSLEQAHQNEIHAGNKALESENNELKKQVGELAEQAQENKSLKKLLSSQEQISAVTWEKITTLKSQLKGTIALDVHQKTVGELNANIESLAKENMELKDELKDCYECVGIMEEMEKVQVENESRIMELEQQLLSAESQLYAYSSGADGIQEQYEQGMFNLSHENQTLQANYESVKQQLDAAHQVLQEVQETMAMYEAEMSKQKDENLRLVRTEAAYKDSLDQVNELKKYIAGIQSEMAARAHLAFAIANETVETGSSVTVEESCQTFFDVVKLETEHKEILDKYSFTRFNNFTLSQKVLKANSGQGITSCRV
jgi:chromosome segregation ATPase